MKFHLHESMANQFFCTQQRVGHNNRDRNEWLRRAASCVSTTESRRNENIRRKNKSDYKNVLDCSGFTDCVSEEDDEIIRLFALQL